MNNEIFFKDRIDAGKDLAKKLSKEIKSNNVTVFGLPRGGIPIAYEVAKSLHAQLEALPVRKISLPDNKELAIGAISFDGTIIFNEAYMRIINASRGEVDKEIENEKKRLEEMVAKFRKNKELPKLESKTVIIVDDGVATGYTAKTALKTIVKHNPKQLILATPIISRDIYSELLNYADSVIGNIVEDMSAIGMFYEDFPQVDDEEVIMILNDKS